MMTIAGVDLAERWKQWAALLAVVGVLVGAGIRFTRAEDAIVEHAQKLRGNDELHVQQAEILQALTSAALAENAAKKARNDICRSLRESGKIKKGDCPKLED